MKCAGVVFIFIALHEQVLCMQKQTSLYCWKKRCFDLFKFCAVSNLLDFKNWQFSRPALCSDLLCVEQRNGFIGVNSGLSFSILDPVPLNNVKLVAIADDVIANMLDIEPKSVLKSLRFAEFTSGNYVLPSSSPMAHRYGGHQFGDWAGQLGDGRALLLGEYINRYVHTGC